MKNVLTVGYRCILHLHSISIEIRFEELICLIDRKSGERNKTKVRFVRKDDICIVRFQILPIGQIICFERFSSFPSLGRLTLRDEGRTVAMGKFLDILH